MQIKLKRSEFNPILTPTNHKWENRYVFNCGVTEFQGRVLILYRAQGDDMVSRLGLAFSDDGYHIAERLSEPIFEPDPDNEYETHGVEDPRISLIDGTYYITYTAASLYPLPFGEDTTEKARLSGHHHYPWRVRASIAHTRDFRSFSRHGVVISHIDSKDAVLFPKKIDNNFLLIHRVHPDARMAIGHNFNAFQERGPVFKPRAHSWDNARIGAGATPIETPWGWLMIYHGKSENGAYSLGLILLDPHNPTITLGRTNLPILEPEEPYEKIGQINNVVFTCGAVKRGDDLLVYYGAADTVIAVASIEYEKLMMWAHHQYAQHHKESTVKL